MPGTPDSYEVAQVSLQGHVITAFANSAVGGRADHCPECGSVTIIQCPGCKRPLRSAGYLNGYLVRAMTTPAPHCYNCGKPLPVARGTAPSR